MQHNDAERQNAVLLIQQLEDLVKRITELERRKDSGDDGLKARSNGITQVEIVSLDERREQYM